MFLKRFKKSWKEFKVCRIISTGRILNFAVSGFRYLFVSRVVPDTSMDAESPMPGPFATTGEGDHEILCDLVTGRTLPVFALLL